MIEIPVLFGVLIITEITCVSMILLMFFRWIKKEVAYLSKIIHGIAIDVSHSNNDVHKIRDNTFHILRHQERSENKQ